MRSIANCGWRFALLVVWIELGSAIANGTSWGIGTFLALAALPLAWAFIHRAPGAGLRPSQQTDAAQQPACTMERRLWALLLLGHHLACIIPCMRMAEHIPRPQLAVLAAGGLVLAAAVARPLSVRALLLTAGIVGALLRITTLPALPIDPRDGDQLPLVLAATKNLLAGRSPYGLFFFPWPLPLVYLPVTWLAYLPTYLLHLDIRLTNLILELLVAAALLFSLRQDEHRREWELGALLWSVCFLSPWTLQWSLHNTHPVFWAVLAGLLAGVRLGKRGLSVVMAGLCLAASPLGVIVAAFVFAHWLCDRGKSGGLLPAGLSIGAAGLLGAVLMLPFWLWDPKGFLFGVLLFHNDSHRHVYELVKLEYMHPEMGFVVLFWKLGLLDALKVVQAGLIAALLALYLWRRAPRQQLPHFITAALILFFVFNPMLHAHYYWVAAVAALFTLRPEEDCSAPLPR